MSNGIEDDCFCKNNDPECKECWYDFSTAVKETALPAKAGALVPGSFRWDVRMRFEECEELLLRKHSDYGPSNIAAAPGGALNGLRVRMHDKLARINHLIDSGVEPSNESLRDSFLDLANYSIIGLLCIDNAWPTK